MTTDLERLLDRVEDMQLLPAQAVRVRRVAEDRRSSLDDLEAVVARDPALAGSILRLANSAFFGMRRKLGTLREALFVLGFAATRDLALALAVSSLGRSQHPLRHQLREQALRGAVAARAVASCTHGQVATGEAFVAALMRDMGRILLLELYGESYATLTSDHPELRAGERERYGADHAELGAACLVRWGLPQVMCDAVASHHDTERGTGLALVVSLADALESGADAVVLDAAALRLDLSQAWVQQARRAMVSAGGTLLLAA